MNLSTLVFDNSIASGTDKIIVNDPIFQTPTITVDLDDEITGTHTSNDTINTGDGNDTIDGSDGNDTLTPGSDHITPGLGKPLTNRSCWCRRYLYFSIDDGTKC